MFARALIAAALLAAAAAPSRAAYTVTVTDTGTGTIDVYLTPDAGPLEVGWFDLTLLITKAGGPSDGGLQFVQAPTATTGPGEFFNDTDYVFFGVSGASGDYAALNLYPGVVTTTSGTNDTFTMVDFVEDPVGGATSVTVSGQVLLARAFIDPTTTPSGYAISLDAATIYDANFNVISNVSAVPAPGGMTLAVIGGITLLALRYSFRAGSSACPKLSSWRKCSKSSPGSIGSPSVSLTPRVTISAYRVC